ncbi:MAG: D-alanyl-D-alanine carboxypeptidase [Ruminococcaceae bacterium]|nr:D-alanyl-D-alanine carboxypeptidase [Oscillospiraceae bacterium]
MKKIILLALCIIGACLLSSCTLSNHEIPIPNLTDLFYDIPGMSDTTESAGTSFLTEAPMQTDIETTLPETSSVPVGIIIPDVLSSKYDDIVIKSKNAFVYDVDKGLQYKKGDLTAPLYPASVTKLYTARVALKYLDPDTVVEAGDELKLRAPDSSVAYISKGQKLTVEMLIEAMMLPSGNDAAYVLANAVGKKLRHDENATPEDAVKTFMFAVNKQAYLDGMYYTHFTTPDGYHSDDHYTCMQDLIIIANLALQNETIMKYTGLYKDQVFFVSGETITWKNNNPFVNPHSSYYRKNVIGLKTGYTSKAGSCIVTAQRIGDSTVLVGVFGASSSDRRNNDTATLLDIAAKYQK